MFNVNEILQIAVNIEKNAVSFYSKAAEQVKDPELTEMFSKLAEWEVSHITHFGKLKDDLTGHLADGAGFDPDGEAALYLKAISDGKIFKVELTEKDLMELPEDPAEIIKAAIAREKDSVIFYQALLEMVPSGMGRDQVKSIIDEEMSHVRYLVGKLATLI
jgi:rubrerythrin